MLRNSGKTAVVLVGGYLLGRLHKAKWAMALAGAAAGRKIRAKGGEGVSGILQSPEVSKLTDNLRSQLLGVGKAAAMAAASGGWTRSPKSSPIVPTRCGPPPTTRPRTKTRTTDIDREEVERGLAGLVLTVVELLRQLMERQAIRRIDQGGLSDAKIEELWLTLMALEDRMTELREHFGLDPEDLNIDLGPLGPLLPRDLRPLIRSTDGVR